MHNVKFPFVCVCISVYVSLSVEDWDLYQRLIDHLYRRHLKTTPTEHPVLMSEPPVSTLVIQWNLRTRDTLGLIVFCPL